jgi:hypothetical protein
MRVPGLDGTVSADVLDDVMFCMSLLRCAMPAHRRRRLPPALTASPSSRSIHLCLSNVQGFIRNSCEKVRVVLKGIADKIS